MLLARRDTGCCSSIARRFPSDIPHGHFIHLQGPGRSFKKWGLLDAVTGSTHCPATTSCSFSISGTFALESTGVQVDGLAFGYGPRRKVLDQCVDRCGGPGGCGGGGEFSGRELPVRRGANHWHSRSIVPVRLLPSVATITIGADGRNCGSRAP